MKYLVLCILLVTLAISGCSNEPPNGSVAITPSSAATYLLGHLDEFAGSDKEISQPGLVQYQERTDKIINALIKQLPNLGHLLDDKPKGEHGSCAVNRVDLHKAPNDLHLLADYMSGHFEELDNDRDGQIKLEDLQRTAAYIHDVFEYISANMYVLGHKIGSHKDGDGKEINEYSINKEDLQRLIKPVSSPSPQSSSGEAGNSSTQPAPPTSTSTSTTLQNPPGATSTAQPTPPVPAHQSFLFDTLAPWVFGLSLSANVLLSLALMHSRQQRSKTG